LIDHWLSGTECQRHHDWYQLLGTVIIRGQVLSIWCQAWYHHYQCELQQMTLCHMNNYNE